MAASKLAAYSSLEEAGKHHWSAILFVTRKMTALGLDALFKSAPCLRTWRAATLVGYGGSMASSCFTSRVSQAPDWHFCPISLCLHFFCNLPLGTFLQFCMLTMDCMFLDVASGFMFVLFCTLLLRYTALLQCSCVFRQLSSPSMQNALAVLVIKCTCLAW